MHPRTVSGVEIAKHRPRPTLGDQRLDRIAWIKKGKRGEEKGAKQDGEIILDFG